MKVKFKSKNEKKVLSIEPSSIVNVESKRNGIFIQQMDSGEWNITYSNKDIDIKELASIEFDN